MQTVIRGQQDELLTDNQRTVLHAIADIGLGHRTPSIDVMASAKFVPDETGLSEDQVNRALRQLVKRGYLLKLDNADDIALGCLRRVVQREGVYSSSRIGPVAGCR